MEDYFFEVDNVKSENRFLIIIAYDIISNKKRNKFAKFLQGYGFRIQKSVFEAFIPDNLYDDLIRGVRKYASDVDSIRVYKIVGKGHIVNFGKENEISTDDTIII